MFNALVLGCGEIGGGGRLIGPVTHGGGYFDNSEIYLSAGVDKDLIQAKFFSDRFGCEYGTDLLAALEMYQPAVVSICTPDETHFELVREILSSSYVPRVIFLEKPACSSKKQYEVMLNLADKRGTVIVVNHSRRFDSDVLELRKRIASGEYGRLVRVRSVYYSGWRHNATHIIDTLSFLFDDSISVISIDHVFRSLYESDPTMEVTAVLNRLNAPVEIRAIDEAYYQLFEFDLWFENARLRLEDFGERIILEKRVVNQIQERVLEIVSAELPDRRKTAMQEALGRIVDYLKTNDTSVLSGCRLEDIGRTIETLWEAQKLYEKTRF